MTTCDYCGKIQAKPIMIEHLEYGQIGVCYDCLVEVYNQHFPEMRFKDSYMMAKNLRCLASGDEEMIFTGYMYA